MAIAEVPVAPKVNLLNSTDGGIESQNQSIVFGPNGMNGAKVQVPFEQLKIIRPLGKGSFGQVNLVETPDGQQFALKEIQLSSDESTQKNIYKELHSYLDYSDQFIVSTFNLYSLGGGAGQNAKIHVLLELAQYGSTKDLLKKIKSGHLTEAGIGMVAIDILRALESIHSRNIIHRDIKPDNLLMTAEAKCKLADFGMATSVLAHDESQAQ